jgi:hypothetical protein
MQRQCWVDEFVLSIAMTASNKTAPSSSPQIYELKMEFDRYEAYSETSPPDYDARLTHFPDIESYQSFEGDDLSLLFCRPQMLNFPKRIEFRGVSEFFQINDPDSVLTTDFPNVREDWPIMSKRMLSALLSVKYFPHQAIPVVMLPNNWESTPENHNYVAVQLLEHLDVFDWDNSFYDIDPKWPNIPKNIEHLVFKEPQTGFPPLFRDSTKRTRLYISAEARAALELAGIRGLKFYDDEKLSTVPFGQAFIKPAGYPDESTRRPRFNRDRVYRLLHDFSRLRGYVEEELSEDTVWLTHLPDIERYRQPSPCPECTGSFWDPHPDLESLFWQPRELDLPERIEFTAVFDSLRINNPKFIRATDYPDVRENWPIMSKRMLNALLSVRDFPHQAIPVVMLSNKMIPTPSGTLIEDDSESHDYVAVQLLEHLDILDWDSSTCTRCPAHPEFMDDFDQLTEIVLTEPPEGFPPLFRITAKPMFLFVSAAGMAALEAAGIKGESYSTIDSN